jgi:hypothetical protein
LPYKPKELRNHNLINELIYNKLNKAAVPLGGSAGVSSYRKPQQLALLSVSQCGVCHNLQVNHHFYI